MEGIRHILKDFKLRASYGNLGNQSVSGNFPYVPSYSIDRNQGYLINNERGVTTTAPSLVSGDLTWEKVTQWNFGFDYGFLQDRLMGSFDIYARYTIGMLTSSEPLPGVLGTGVPNTNAADLKTKGWEFTIGWKDHIKPVGLNYNVSFVLGDAVAEITKFANPTGSLGSRYVGQRIGEIWGYESNGLFKSYEEIAEAPSQARLYNGTWHPGDVRYVDRNGDNEISTGANTLEDPGDRYIIGNSQPRYEYGITLGAAWKGIDLTIFMQGIGKRDWWVDDRYWGVNGRWAVPARDIDSYWTEENPDGFMPKLYQQSRGNRQTCTRYLQNAAYLRFKQLSIGYSLPSKWTKSISLEKVRLYFTGQNLFTYTKLSKLYDPEIVGSAGSASSVVSNLTYPISRTISFGLNVTF